MDDERPTEPAPFATRLESTGTPGPASRSAAAPLLRVGRVPASLSSDSSRREEFVRSVATTRFTHIVHLADIHLRTGNVQDSRQVEYEHVFANLDDELGRLAPVRAGTALIVVCGDVFHNKSRVETPAIHLWTLFVSILARHAPTVLIAGNHDFRQDDPAMPDLIQVHLDHWTPDVHPCIYVDDRQPLQSGNVMLVTVPVKETLRVADARATVARQPSFPPPETLRAVAGVDVVVAMFHGTVAQARLPDGQRMSKTSTYALGAFAGYDMVLLGDNHLQQVHTRDPGSNRGAWGYPGSLVQQTAGEDLLGHGFLLWDLTTRTAEAHHVHNDYATLSLSYDASTGTVHVNRVISAPAMFSSTLVPSRPPVLPPGPVMMDVDAGESMASRAPSTQHGALVDGTDAEAPLFQPTMTLEAASKALERSGYRFPRHPQVVFAGTSGTHDAVANLLRTQGGGAEPSLWRLRRGPGVQLHGLTPNESHTQVSQLDEFSRPKKWFEFVQSQDALLAAKVDSLGWFAFDGGMNDAAVGAHYAFLLPKAMSGQDARLLPELADELNKRISNTGLQKAARGLFDALKNQAASMRKVVKLHHISWSWTFGYGPDNYFDFDAADGEVAIVNGPNAIGKSAFLDTICLGLFGITGSNRRFGDKGVQQTKDDYVNHQCPPNTSASVKIVFSLRGPPGAPHHNTAAAAGMHVIERFFKRSTATRASGVQGMGRATDAELWNSNSVLARGVPTVDAWVKNNVGTLQELMRTTLVAQFDRENFFTATAAEQLQLVEAAVNLTSIEAFSQLLHEACNGYSSILVSAELLLKKVRNDLRAKGGPVIAAAETLQTGMASELMGEDGAASAGPEPASGHQNGKANATGAERIRQLQERKDEIESKSEKLQRERDRAAALAGSMLGDQDSFLSRGTGQGSSPPSATPDVTEVAVAELRDRMDKARQAILENKDASEHDVQQNNIRVKKGMAQERFNSFGGEKSAKATVRKVTQTADLEKVRKCIESELSALNATEGAAGTSIDLESGDVAACDPLALIPLLQESADGCGMPPPQTMDDIAVAVSEVQDKLRALTAEHTGLVDALVTASVGKAVAGTATVAAHGAASSKKVRAHAASHSDLNTVLQQMQATATYAGQLALVQMANQKSEEGADAVAARAKEAEKQLKKEQSLTDELTRVENALEARKAQQSITRLTAYLDAETALHNTTMREAATRHRQLVEQHEQLQSELRELNERIATETEAASKVEERRRLTEQEKLCGALLEDWTAAKESCEQLYGLFGAKPMKAARGAARAGNQRGTYKDWLYTDYVLPTLQRETNGFLEAIAPGLTLKLDYEQSQFKLTACHQLLPRHAGGSEPGDAAAEQPQTQMSFFSSSGYQQFVFGLAMRRALVALGTSSTRLEHLFIDEGFTACDRSNLGRAGEVLRQLLQPELFASIVVVSHLDAVRDEVNVPFQATIKRVPPRWHALLQFGQERGEDDVARLTAPETAPSTILDDLPWRRDGGRAPWPTTHALSTTVPIAPAAAIPIRRRGRPPTNSYTNVQPVQSNLESLPKSRTTTPMRMDSNEKGHYDYLVAGSAQVLWQPPYQASQGLAAAGSVARPTRLMAPKLAAAWTQRPTTTASVSGGDGQTRRTDSSPSPRNRLLSKSKHLAGSTVANKDSGDGGLPAFQVGRRRVRSDSDDAADDADPDSQVDDMAGSAGPATKKQVKQPDVIALDDSDDSS
jgi:hypothetical protein